jgi:hypothetical protein
MNNLNLEIIENKRQLLNANVLQQQLSMKNQVKDQELNELKEYTTILKNEKETKFQRLMNEKSIIQNEIQSSSILEKQLSFDNQTKDQEITQLKDIINNVKKEIRENKLNLQNSILSHQNLLQDNNQKKSRTK